MNTTCLSHLEFELGYLSLLTKAGLKPLSRWEKDFSSAIEDSLGELGLKTRVVERSVQSGQRLRELLFSTSDECLDLYARRFDGTPVDRSPATRRIEGLLFGYPSCCVESYAARGYVPNALGRRDQRILFHWACPNCAITPLLLPHYRRIYRACRQSSRRGSAKWLTPDFRVPDWRAHLRRAVALAASLVALGTVNVPAVRAAGGAGDPLDPHLIALPLLDDPDRDFLATAEETILGTDPHVFDENGNAIADGIDLAHELSAAIDGLPTTPSANEPYVTHHLAFGLETCQICGEQINMGFLTVHHPLENQHLDMPYMGKHFLEHGSFTYSGSLHSGRVNPVLLKLLLTAEGLGHFLAEPPGTDRDQDGLRQWEEPDLGTDPEKPDTDGDHLIDGIDLARELRQRLEALPRVPTLESPYIVEHPMDGVELCPRCGEWIVMGIWEVINPVTHDQISISSMALHYMEHGGFGWKGGQLLGGQGRVNPRHLQAVLTSHPNRHLLPVTPDRDADLLTDSEEVDLGSDPTNPDEDRNAVRDGIDLARATACAIAGLPTAPQPDQIYRLDFLLRGLEQCDICGTNVNMGHLTVCNPLAQLYVKVPYITLHYLEHDSFSYAGNVHGTGRIDVKLLQDALHSTGPSHMLPVPDDGDHDGLKDDEERHFNTNPANPDTNLDGVPDGFTLARQMWSEVEALPRSADPSVTPPPGHCYAVDHLLRGVVPCSVCGELVNMGWVEVINPAEQLSLDIPYLALHFMRHGSYAYSSQDRINPCLLDVVLHGDGTAHLVPVPGDNDGDGLLDVEEPHFGTRPDNPDTNGDGVLDGVALARTMDQRIKALPTTPRPSGAYVMHYETDCMAPCPVCGVDVNCGHEEITNTWSGLSLTISYMNAHYLAHGSFAASPTERVDPVRLDAILEPAVRIAAGPDGVTLRWTGQPGHTYQIFTAPDLAGPWAPGPIFAGEGSELEYTEDSSGDLSKKFYKIVGR